MGEITACIPESCKKRCLLRSSLNLLRDILYIWLCVYTTRKLVDYTGGMSKLWDVLLWSTYAVVQGTIATGVWVVGHECGHGAFSEFNQLNDVLGYILHTVLLVPYYSWKYSHHKHHQYTNHLTWGETHVPSTLGEMGSRPMTIRRWIGDDGFAVYEVIAHLVFGWPMYLLTNATGGKLNYNGDPIADVYSDTVPFKPAGAIPSPNAASRFWRVRLRRMNHFIGAESDVFPPAIQHLVTLSGLGCLAVVVGLVIWGSVVGWGSVLCWYVGPYLVTNMYLVTYTWLQHSHPNIPHYGDDSFTWLRGALSTIDRPYPWIIDELHHGIGTTHVLHHVDFKIPHYNAKEASRHLAAKLGPLYRRDNTGILESLWTACKTAHYVDGVNSVQYLKSLRDYEELLHPEQDVQDTDIPVSAMCVTNGGSSSFLSAGGGSENTKNACQRVAKHAEGLGDEQTRRAAIATTVEVGA